MNAGFKVEYMLGRDTGRVSARLSKVRMKEEKRKRRGRGSMGAKKALKDFPPS